MARWVKEVVALKSGAGTPLWTMDHFGPFFALLPHKNPKKQNFEKMKKKKKKTPGDTIISHMCTVNENHMMYGSWDMEHDGQSFLSFRTIFCPFTLLKTQKPKFWKNEKNWRYLEILSFYTRVPKIMIICHTASLSEIWSMTDVYNWYFSFWAIFCPFPPSHQEKWKFQKNEKKSLEISSFYASTPKIMIICYAVPEIWCATDVIAILDFFVTFYTRNSPKNQT